MCENEQNMIQDCVLSMVLSGRRHGRHVIPQQNVGEKDTVFWCEIVRVGGHEKRVQERPTLFNRCIVVKVRMYVAHVVDESQDEHIN